jgi:hypothetical protein
VQIVIGDKQMAIHFHYLEMAIEKLFKIEALAANPALRAIDAEARNET